MTEKEDRSKENFIERKMLEDAEELVAAGKLSKGKLNKARALKNDDKRFERILALVQEARGIEPPPEDDEDEEEETEEEVIEQIGDLLKLGDEKGAAELAEDIAFKDVERELDEELAKTGRYIPAGVIVPILDVALGMSRSIRLWNGHDEFVRSVNNQFRDFNHLTFKQVRALVKILERYHSQVTDPKLLVRYNRAQRYVKLFKSKTKDMD